MAGENGLEGKVALVTGGGSGIGEAIVREMADRGARVVVADFDVPAAERVASGLGGKDKAAAVRVDVADPAAVDAMVRFTTETFGKLDIAVNNAGIGGEASPTGDYSIEGWKRVSM
jgi:NAD(P)-dependent dehydrogenase (short-subunit alcohol dehydrogenase family)